MDRTILIDAIEQATAERIRPEQVSPVGGGCINEAWILRAGERRYFLKVNQADRLAMFEAEQQALQVLAAAQAVRVPQPYGCAVVGPWAFLVMEALELGSRGRSAELGEQLAALHRVSQPYFGFMADNYIGTTEQPNGWDADWVSFYGERRLGHQLALAGRRGLSRRILEAGERLREALPVFFSDYDPQPSLLHGDLWGGNYGFLIDGTPVLFDPASYFGDREADIAMTELFGGFDRAFRAAYEQSWPLDPGYAQRRELYNLYHILNHYNLFGGGYGRQAESLIQRLLAETH